MIDAVLFDYKKGELKALYDLALKLSVKLSEEDWAFRLFSDPEKAEAHILSTISDFACIDVCGDGGLDLARSAREKSSSTLMLLVADETISPMKYLNAAIMPNSLLLRPIGAKQAASGFSDLFKMIVRTKESSDDDRFSFNYEGGTKVIPYDQIYYFEAREKKVYVNVGNQEYGFYGVIDQLQSTLPKTFLRSHRSFIVSKSKIDRVYLSKNSIDLVDGQFVPLSRSYKADFKGLG